MGVNPGTNTIEQLESIEQASQFFKKAEKASGNKFVSKPMLLRPDGSPVPEHWPVFREGEEVVLKNYTFKVGYMGEKCLLLEPLGIVEIGSEKK